MIYKSSKKHFVSHCSIISKLFSYRPDASMWIFLYISLKPMVVEVGTTSAAQDCTDRFSKPKIKFILFLVFAESTLPTYSRHEKKSR